MAELLLKGAPAATSLTQYSAAQAAGLAERGVVPTLAVIRVGAREDDLSYERGLTKRAEKAGVAVRVNELPADCTQDQLMDAIGAANENDEVHGILMFRPLPAQLDEAAACAAISPAKDVDCAGPASLARVFCGEREGFAPCTADAVVALLRYYDVPLAGANVCVVGRSLVIGRPVAMLLLAQDATVTICHSKTADLAARCREADVLVVATGRPGTIGAECVRPGQTVVDVGINWDAQAGKLVGDVAFAAAEPVVRAITPVPGGVGSLTTAVLMNHVVQAAERALA